MRTSSCRSSQRQWPLQVRRSGLARCLMIRFGCLVNADVIHMISACGEPKLCATGVRSEASKAPIKRRSFPSHLTACSCNPVKVQCIGGWANGALSCCHGQESQGQGQHETTGCHFGWDYAATLWTGRSIQPYDPHCKVLKGGNVPFYCEGAEPVSVPAGGTFHHHHKCGSRQRPCQSMIKTIQVGT